MKKISSLFCSPLFRKSTRRKSRRSTKAPRTTTTRHLKAPPPHPLLLLLPPRALHTPSEVPSTPIETPLLPQKRRNRPTRPILTKTRLPAPEDPDSLAQKPEMTPLRRPLLLLSRPPPPPLLPLHPPPLLPRMKSQLYRIQPPSFTTTTAALCLHQAEGRGRAHP